jgi:SNF family Na+-dependent transporter
MKDLLGTLVNVPGTDECNAFDTGEYIAGGPNVDNKFSWQLMLALMFTWAVTYFCVFKGVKSSSYVVWVTVPGPVIFIFIMVINGLCLPNADEGIRMYLRGEIDGKVPALSEKLSNGQMWADACG